MRKYKISQNVFIIYNQGNTILTICSNYPNQFQYQLWGSPVEWPRDVTTHAQTSSIAARSLLPSFRPAVTGQRIPKAKKNSICRVRHSTWHPWRPTCLTQTQWWWALIRAKGTESKSYRSKFFPFLPPLPLFMALSDQDFLSNARFCSHISFHYVKVLGKP